MKFSVLLYWKRARCNEGIKLYRVYVNDELKMYTPDSEPKLTLPGLDFGIEYRVYVTAVSNFNRVSKKSNTVIIKVDERALNYMLNVDI